MEKLGDILKKPLPPAKILEDLKALLKIEKVNQAVMSAMSAARNEQKTRLMLHNENHRIGAPLYLRGDKLEVGFAGPDAYEGLRIQGGDFGGRAQEGVNIDGD